jgi:hypothetical protein
MLVVASLALPLPLSLHARSATEALSPTGAETRGLTLLVSGGTSGELLPCGCIWSARGGLARRATVLAGWRAAAREDEVVRVELGNLQSDHPMTATLENGALYEALRRESVSVVNVGAEDAARGHEALTEMAEKTEARLISANLVYHDSGEPRFEPFVLVGGRGAPRVALVGLTRPEPTLVLGGERNRTLLVEDPGEALIRWLPRAEQSAEYVLVLSDLRRHQANALLRDHPSLLALLAPSFSYEADGPLADARGVLSFEDQGVQVLSYRIGPGGETFARRGTLHDQVPEDPETASRLEPILDGINASLRSGHLGLEPDPLDERYAALASCAGCHEREHRIWSRGPHARAWETLLRSNREWTVACNVCHVTGAGDDEAWLDPARSPQLVAVQCEACHGPGREHAESPAAGYGAVNMKHCRACHKELFSPGFVPEEAWFDISHGAEVEDDPS